MWLDTFVNNWQLNDFHMTEPRIVLNILITISLRLDKLFQFFNLYFHSNNPFGTKSARIGEWMGHFFVGKWMNSCQRQTHVLTSDLTHGWFVIVLYSCVCLFERIICNSVDFIFNSFNLSTTSHDLTETNLCPVVS